VQEDGLHVGWLPGNICGGRLSPFFGGGYLSTEEKEDVFHVGAVVLAGELTGGPLL
jgi:hypothetical protein